MGLGDVYKRQTFTVTEAAAVGLAAATPVATITDANVQTALRGNYTPAAGPVYVCLLYTSDAADERSSVDLGGRRIIKNKKIKKKKHKEKKKNEIVRWRMERVYAQTDRTQANTISSHHALLEHNTR